MPKLNFRLRDDNNYVKQSKTCAKIMRGTKIAQNTSKLGLLQEQLNGSLYQYGRTLTVQLLRQSKG